MGWVQRKIGEWAVRRSEADLQRQVAAYRSMDDEDVALILVVATYARIGLKLHGVLSEEALDGSREREFEAAWTVRPIGRLIKQAQRRGNPVAASGLMVWLHSLRALNAPELRDGGREMWAELSRGFPHVEVALSQTDEMFGFDTTNSDEIPLSSFRFVPVGLEPTTP